jgi:hypothetical protein
MLAGHRIKPMGVPLPGTRPSGFRLVLIVGSARVAGLPERARVVFAKASEFEPLQGNLPEFLFKAIVEETKMADRTLPDRFGLIVKYVSSRSMAGPVPNSIVGHTQHEGRCAEQCEPSAQRLRIGTNR